MPLQLNAEVVQGAPEHARDMCSGVSGSVSAYAVTTRAYLPRSFSAASPSAIAPPPINKGLHLRRRAPEVHRSPEHEHVAFEKYRVQQLHIVLLDALSSASARRTCPARSYAEATDVRNIAFSSSAACSPDNRVHKRPRVPIHPRAPTEGCNSHMINSQSQRYLLVADVSPKFQSTRAMKASNGLHGQHPVLSISATAWYLARFSPLASHR